jgi:hypothetical protein
MNWLGFLKVFGVCLASLILAACAKPNLTSTPTLTPTLEPPNLLIETRGEAYLKREGRTHYVTVTLGVEVRRGDLVRPASGQDIKILCADLSLYTMTHGGGCPCKDENEPVLHYGKTRIIAPKTPQSSVPYPYILHPRSTVVLTARPLLRWHDTGAMSYTVAIDKGGREIWKQAGVRNTEIYYPDDAPTLQPGIDYLLKITDEVSNRSSDEDPAKGVGFRVLSKKDQAKVEGHRGEILTLPLSDPARYFALAVYYAGEGLRGEALAQLDKAINLGLDAPAVLLWQGNLLLAMKLPNEAEITYLETLASAEHMGDLETQAAAYVGLWQVTGNERHFDEAFKLYVDLGDKVAAEALRQKKEQ